MARRPVAAGGVARGTVATTASRQEQDDDEHYQGEGDDRGHLHPTRGASRTRFIFCHVGLGERVAGPTVCET